MCLFIKEFITSPFATGAIASSSPELANLITDTAKLENRNAILEIGSGMGIFTKRIFDVMDKSSKFFVIELNPKFARETKKQCPGIEVFNDSATNINKYLSRMNLGGCDCIISSLPWTAFCDNLQNDLLESIHASLLPGGIFLTYVYIHSQFMPSGVRFRKKLISKFGNINKTQTVWKNIPPAFIYYVTRDDFI